MKISTFKKILPALRLISPPRGKHPNDRTFDIQGGLENGLVIKAADMNTDLEIKSSGVNTANFDGCVNFAKFNTVIGALKSMPSFDYAVGDGEQNLDALVLTSGKRTIKLESANAERIDYGERSFIASAGKGLDWDVSRLTEGLEYISPAISNDETRFHLNGVLLAASGDMVATDGHRLHIYNYHHDDDFVAPFFENARDEYDTIVPKRYVGMLQAAVKACGGSRSVVYSERGVQRESRYLRFMVEGNDLSFKITFKLIDSRFPSYQDVIPNKYETRASVAVNILEFSPAVKLIGKMLNNDCLKTAVLQLINGKLLIRGGGVVESIIAPRTTGECVEYGKIKVGANSKYLSEAADFPGECFSVEFGDALDPIKFSQGAFLGVVMPQRI